MTKANEVIVDALEDLIVQADEAPIEPSEALVAIRALNDMMFSWAVLGIDLGYSEISDLADDLTVPLGAIRGIKANLSLELAPKYNVAVPPSLVAKAQHGYDACVNIAISMAASEFPSTLPQGSGNTYPGYTNDTFYPSQEDTILTEGGGSIALEEDAETS